MDVKVRLSKSVLGQAEADAVSRVILESGFLGMSREVQAFERELSEFIGGGREVICTNAATTALHLALQAAGIGDGDEVLVPTITYVASFQAISASGATPVACDVDYETSWLDLADAERRITDRTKAIMPVHYASGTGELAALRKLAKKHNLRVIEDAAHAFGCTFEDEYVGATGDIVCFSFQGTKNITSGEGGAIVTADLEVAERARDLRLLGVLKDTERRYARERSWEFDVEEQGWRYHMSDIMAAIGRVQLRRFAEEFRPTRIYLAERYREKLRDLEDVRTLPLEYGPIVPHIYPIYITNGARDAVREALAQQGIETGIHYKPSHLLTLYGGGQERLPNAERLYEEMLTLPLHPALTESQQDQVVQIVSWVVRRWQSAEESRLQATVA